VALEEKLELVERLYAERGLPATYQICDAMQPAHLDDVLAVRGYDPCAHSQVQTASLRRLLQTLPPLQLFPHFELEVAEEFDEAWFELYCRAEGLDGGAQGVRRTILAQIGPLHGFVTLRCAGAPAAVGLGVVENGWLGIFCMATLPEFRRQGAARGILRTLAIWARLYEAQRAYLQVMDDNAAGLGLYAAAGFQPAYHYHYRQKRL
jgi:GNAT superfamily N-acetyltransferase